MPVSTAPGALEVLRATIASRERSLGKQFAAFRKNTYDRVGDPLASILDRIATINASGTFTPIGARQEIAKLLRASMKELRTAKDAVTTTLGPLRAQRGKDALDRSFAFSDPTDRLIRKLDMHALAAHLRTMDSLALQERIRLAVEDHASDATMLFYDTMRDSARMGLPIVSEEAFKSFADALAEKSDPAIGEIAELERAYQDAFANGVAVIRELAEQHRVDLHPDAAA